MISMWRYNARRKGLASDEQQQAQTLLNQLKARGKWPAKPDLLAWFGNKGTEWQDRQTQAIPKRRHASRRR